MDPVDREFKYEEQNGTPRLTPRQGRRVKHKYGSRKTHSHDDLLLLAQPDGKKVKRQRCPRCSPPTRQARRVGGVPVE